MLAYIKGSLEIKTMSYVVIDVGGLGYKVNMSLRGIEKLGKIGDGVKVHTYYKVQEDDISIYGFSNQEELRMFELLISVSGVGAKTALSMLAVSEPSEFALAIITENVDFLKKLPGIGAKSAARIILELKDKMKKEEMTLNTDSTEIQNAVSMDNGQEEAIAALMVLGYNKTEIQKAFMKMEKTGLTTEDLIKKGLMLLSN